MSHLCRRTSSRWECGEAGAPDRILPREECPDRCCFLGLCPWGPFPCVDLWPRLLAQSVLRRRGVELLAAGGVSRPLLRLRLLLLLHVRRAHVRLRGRVRVRPGHARYVSTPDARCVASRFATFRCDHRLCCCASHEAHCAHPARVNP